MYLKEETIKQFALGGEVEIGVVVDSGFDTKDLFEDIIRQIFVFEKNYSRFLPSSRLTKLNQSGGAYFDKNDDFRDLLYVAKQLSLDSGGLYNPFILPGLQKTGYLKTSDEKYTTDEAIDYRDRAYYDIDRLLIDNQKVTIPINSAIDLGGCAKGFLADKLARELWVNKIIKGVWVNLSGDIAIFGHDQSGQSITVDIQRFDQDVPEMIISAKNEPISIATSGRLSRDGKQVKTHHIINPATGESAETDVILATVVCSDGAQADAFASCVVILGAEKGQQFLKTRGINTYCIQYKLSGKIRTIIEGDIAVQKEVVHA